MDIDCLLVIFRDLCQGRLFAARGPKVLGVDFAEMKAQQEDARHGVTMLVESGLGHCPGATPERTITKRQADAGPHLLKQRFSLRIHGIKRLRRNL